jgi:hypothetical protein
MLTDRLNVLFYNDDGMSVYVNLLRIAGYWSNDTKLSAHINVFVDIGPWSDTKKHHHSTTSTTTTTTITTITTTIINNNINNLALSLKTAASEEKIKSHLHSI